MALLTASPNLIIVDHDTGKKDGDTLIEYDSQLPTPVYLWERRGNSNWAMVSLFQRVGTKDADLRGSFNIPLQIGSRYEARLYKERNADPLNLSDFPPLAMVAVLCLLDEPYPRPLAVDPKLTVGGTWCELYVYTVVDAFVQLEVSRQPPQTNSVGMLVFPKNSVIAQAQSGLNTKHLGEFEPLIPYSDYHLIITAVDQFGNWHTRELAFTTLKQWVTFQFTNVYVNNDGDPHDAGEADFVMALHDDSGQVNYQKFGDDSYKVADGQNIALNFPSYLWSPVGAVRVAVGGTECDGWEFFDGEDELAGNSLGEGEPMFFPAGKTSEKVTAQTAQFTAVPQADGDNFEFTVTAVYSVDYS